MTATLVKILNYFDDRANPYMVKELRQAVTNRILLLILSAFLLWQPVALLLGYDLSSRNPAMGILLMQLLGLLVFSFLALPFYVGSVCAAEKRYTCNMLYATPMEPFSVVAGKIKSGLCLMLLAMSISLPCMFGMSLFRGASMLSIAGVAVFLLLYCTTNISYGIFLGLISRRPFLSTFFIFCYIIFLMIETSCFIGTAEVIISGISAESLIMMIIATLFGILIVDAILIGLATVAIEPIMWS